jgi:hypothetical protein
LSSLLIPKKSYKALPVFTLLFCNKGGYLKMVLN